MGKAVVCASKDKKTLYIMDSFSEHSIETGSLLIGLIDKEYDDFHISNFNIQLRLRSLLDKNEYELLKKDFQDVIHYVFDDELEDCPYIVSGTPMQRYCFYTWKVNPEFEEGINLKLLTACFPYVNNKPAFMNYKQISTASDEDIAGIILQSGIVLDEYYEFSTLKDLLYFDLISILKGNTIIKKCKNCGKYFVPQGRVDTKYCNRIAPNSKKTCYQIGAIKVYTEEKKKDPIYLAYIKEYKKRNTRARYDPRAKAKEDFIKWSKAARDMRKKAQNNEITLEEFEKWLKESE